MPQEPVNWSVEDIYKIDEELKTLREEARKQEEIMRKRNFRERTAKKAESSWLGDIAAWYNKRNIGAKDQLESMKQGKMVVDLNAQDMEDKEQAGRKFAGDMARGAINMTPGMAPEPGDFLSSAGNLGEAIVSAYLTKRGLGPPMPKGALPRSGAMQKIFSPLLESATGEKMSTFLAGQDFANNIVSDSHAPLAMNIANLGIGRGMTRAIQSNPLLKRMLSGDPSIPNEPGQVGKILSLFGLSALEGAGVGAAGGAMDGDIKGGALRGAIGGGLMGGMSRAGGQFLYPAFLQSPAKAEEDLADFFSTKLRPKVDPTKVYKSDQHMADLMHATAMEPDMPGAFNMVDGKVEYPRYGWTPDTETGFKTQLEKMFGGGSKAEMLAKLEKQFKAKPYVEKTRPDGVGGTVTYKVPITDPAQIEDSWKKLQDEFNTKYDQRLGINMQNSGMSKQQLLEQYVNGTYEVGRNQKRNEFQERINRFLHHDNVKMDQRSPELYQTLTDIKSEKKWLNWMSDGSIKVMSGKSPKASAAVRINEDQYAPELSNETYVKNISKIEQSGSGGGSSPAETFARTAETNPAFARKIVEKIKSNNWDSPNASMSERSAAGSLMKIGNSRQFTDHMLENPGAFKAAVYHLKGDPDLEHSMKKNLIDSMWDSMVQLKTPKPESGGKVGDGKHLFDKVADLDPDAMDQLFGKGAHQGLKDLAAAHKLAVNKIGEQSYTTQTKDIVMPALFFTYMAAETGMLANKAAKYVGFGGASAAKFGLWVADPNNRVRLVEFLLKKDGTGAKALRRFWENPEVYGRKGNEIMKLITTAMGVNNDDSEYAKEAAKVKAERGIE